MIKSKSDLNYYIDEDRIASRRATNKAKLFGDECWKYQLALRKQEYYFNNLGIISRLFYFYYKFRLHKLSLLTGFSIPINAVGPGLYLPHRGTIIINPKTKIGKNCRIHVCVNIGEDINGNAPTIGDNVYFGPGVKAFGEIKIASHIKIGANAVVNKSFLEENVVIGGVPAKVLDK